MDSENIVAMREDVIAMTNEIQRLPPRFDVEPMKFNMDFGINLSILIILLIFSGLLFLPSKMLLDTSYEAGSKNETKFSVEPANATNFLNSMKFREKRLCPGLDYRYWLTSIFYTNYDRNCTYAVRKQRQRGIAPRKDEKVVVVADAPNNDREIINCGNEKKKMPISHNYSGAIDEIRASRPKSVPVTGHILAMLLVVSAVAAFVEVLRIRFINPKAAPADEPAGSRKGSTFELIPQGRPFFPRHMMKSQRSFELQALQRSTIRPFGTHHPPLIRRSSFPTYLMNPTNLATISDGPTSRSASRRTSINSETAIIDPALLHRRARLIRRH